MAAAASVGARDAAGPRLPWPATATASPRVRSASGPVRLRPGAADAAVRLRIDPGFAAPRRTGCPSQCGAACAAAARPASSGARRRCVSCSARTPSAGRPLHPGRHWELPESPSRTAPASRWRGLMLDVARHFMPKDGVLRYLDLMAAHKLNVFHFHLTDDQGWRVEIKRYPRLTEVGAWRTRTKCGHRASPLWDEKPHGGFYTQDDIREIVAYAAERHITVVPEIDVPGHSQAAIAAYPELGNTDVVDTGGALAVWDTWGVNPNVLAPTENTLRFYEGVLRGGAGAVPVGRSSTSAATSAPRTSGRPRRPPRRASGNSGSPTRRSCSPGSSGTSTSWLSARGRRLIGWDEILEGGLAPGAAVSSWRGYAGGIAAAEAGHDVVMCPEQQVYLDHRQARRRRTSPCPSVTCAPWRTSTASSPCRRS